MTCSTCNTAAEARKVPFGDKFISLEICECGAQKIAEKYSKTRYEPIAKQPDRKTLAGGE